MVITLGSSHSSQESGLVGHQAGLAAHAGAQVPSSGKAGWPFHRETADPQGILGRKKRECGQSGAAPPAGLAADDAPGRAGRPSKANVRSRAWNRRGRPTLEGAARPYTVAEFLAHRDFPAAAEAQHRARGSSSQASSTGLQEMISASRPEATGLSPSRVRGASRILLEQQARASRRQRLMAKRFPRWAVMPSCGWCRGCGEQVAGLVDASPGKACSHSARLVLIQAASAGQPSAQSTARGWVTWSMGVA